jgi:hypothetical protein
VSTTVCRPLHISVLLPRLRVHCGAVPINAVGQLSVLPLLQRRDARPPPPILLPATATARRRQDRGGRLRLCAVYLRSSWVL